jgi:hypothetical protein
MSRLYPRLLEAVALSRHEEFVGLDVPGLRRRADVRHPSAVFAATGGTRVEPSGLAALADGIRSLATDAGYPGPLRSDSVRNRFDARVGAYLHASMDLVAAEASARSMWAFLALILLPDVAYWRFPEPSRDRVLATDITRHVFGRLWWRAHLLFDEAATDPYHLLETFAESAFDQIFARRRAIGGSRALIRALADCWTKEDLESMSEREVLRETLKVLARRGAFQAYETLDHSVLVAEVSDIIRTQLTAMRAEAGTA